jgi:dihydropteroate synthase
VIWRGRQFEFSFPRPTLVMGVLNVTPDSFSDAGRFTEVEAAVARAHEMVRQGADIVDVGGESTRPGAETVSEAEELRRVVPVIEALTGNLGAPISIDTVKPGVARAALAAGAAIVNDIAANRENDGMWRVVAETGAGYVAMHMQGTPQTMQLNPSYTDVVEEVGAFFRERLARLDQCGVRAEQVTLEPGIGFGKTLEHNLQLLAGTAAFIPFARPLLLGVSRKSFLGRLLGAELPDRLAGSLACAAWAVGEGVHILRAHDVAETVHAARMVEALRARR